MKLLSILVLSFMSLSAFANSDAILGVWKNIDDKTGKEQSLIDVKETDGVLSGNIIKLFDPSTPDQICSKCTDDRKDHPFLGIELFRNVTKKKENVWSGGKILDPETGNEYRVKFILRDDGTLKVRGYIGTPLLGRTQIWHRVEEENNAVAEESNAAQ